MSKPHSEEYEIAPQGSNGNGSSQVQPNDVSETPEANSTSEHELVHSQPSDPSNGNGSLKEYESAEDNGHESEAIQSENSSPDHHGEQMEQGKQPSQDDTPKSEKDKVVDQAKKDYQETKESVNKAKDTLKDLASGKANIVDAAFAVKGAIDAVQGLTGKLSSAAMMPVMKALSAFKGQAVLPAGKQMDPVMGIDVHMVTIPPSPAPVPLPHPYIGILFNPKDFVSCAINTVKPAVMAAIPEPAEDAKSGIATSLAKNKDAIAGIAMGIAGLSASVKFGSFIPRAVTGTPTKNIPHIPMGAGFHPAFVASVAKNHGKAFLGSLFVAADGDPMVGSFHLHYDCWDVGIVDLFKGLRKGTKKAEPGAPLAQLYVPSGTVLPIPWGKPVLVNSIPTPINPLALLDKLFKAGLGKLKAAGRKAAQKGLDKLTGKVGCGALTKVSKLIGTGQSHPVDVAEGHFYTDNIDFSLPGPIPLIWERTWYSYSDYKGPLGYGWHHSYDMALAVDEETGMAVLRMSDGRVTDFELPLTTEGTYKRSEKLTLYRHDEGYFYVTDKKGLIYRFTKHEYRNPYNRTCCYLLQSIANRNGFAVRFTYNEKGLLNRIIDSAGRKLKVNNDDNGRIISIDAPHPQLREKTFQISSYSYRLEGDMSHHFDALNQAMSFDYENHLMVREVWRNGLNWHFRYDRKKGTEAKCVEVWGDNDLLHYKFDYSNSEYTVVINSLGYRKIFYHKNGVVIKYVDANGSEWKYRYNRFNELESEIDPLENERNYGYDKLGNLTTNADPAGAFQHISYSRPDFPFLPTGALDTAGGRWKWEYDEHGNIIRDTNPTGSLTIFKYQDGLISEIINPRGAVTQLEFDPDFNLSKIRTANGAESSYKYDVLGNCISLQNPNGLIQRRSYDLNRRIVHVADYDGNVVELEYDGIDNLTRYRDRQRNIVFTYKGLWKVTSRRENGSTIYFKYDTEEQLAEIINEHGATFKKTYDPAGDVIQETSFDQTTRQYRRNRAGWVTAIDRPDGRFTQYTYDACGRVVSLAYSDGGTEVYAYNKKGEVIGASNEHAEILLERDVMGNVIKETTNGKWIVSEYDNTSNRVFIGSSFGAKISQSYDMMDNLQRMEEGVWQLELSHDKLCLEIARSFSGVIDCEWQRDGVGRPKLLRVQAKNSAVRLQKRYTWDVNGRLKQIRDKHGVISLEHDNSGHLIKTVFPDGSEQLRNYDAVGNIYSSDSFTDRVYSTGGRIVKSHEWKYKYDAEGNIIEKIGSNGKRWKYFWNHAGLLVKVIRPDDSCVEFTYDAFRRRISKRFKDTITNFLWDGNLLMHEWKVSASTGTNLSELNVGDNGIVTWLFDGESYSPAGKIKNEKHYSIVTDHLGTPIQMFREDGDLIWHGEVDSYGKLRVEKGQPGSCPFRYQGQYEDYETGLSYNRFRYYSPEEGIFLSQDPIGIEGGITLYGYVSDPNMWIDVFGLNSTALNKDLDGETGDKKQAHHVIPCAVWRDNEAFLNEVGMEGQRDKKENGLLMHDNEADGKKNGRALYHNGSHANYNEKVNSELQKIKERYDEHGNKKRAKKEIQDLQKRLKRNLNRKSKSGCQRLS